MNSNNFTVEELRHKHILAKAKNRGQVPVEWHKNNTLTKETFPEFQRVMKQADKDFENKSDKP